MMHMKNDKSTCTSKLTRRYYIGASGTDFTGHTNDVLGRKDGEEVQPHNTDSRPVVFR